MTLKTLFSFFVFSFAFWAQGAQAATVSATHGTDHATVALRSEVVKVAAGKPFWLKLEFDLAEGWHIYWKNPGDSGLAPRLEWTLPEGFTAEAIHWPTPERIAIGGLVNYGYEEEASLLIPILPPKNLAEGEDISITLKANWLICHEICIPESGEFHLALTAAKEAELSDDAESIAANLKALPTLAEKAGSKVLADKSLTLTLSGIKEQGEVYFYAEDQGVVAHTESQPWKQEGDALTATLPRGTAALPEALKGVLEIISDDGEMRYYQVTFGKEAAPAPQKNPTPAPAPAPEVKKNNLSIASALFFALIGGLILNAMPCVFPVLSLKALAIARKAEADPKAVKLQGLAYLVGCVTCFMALAGVLIALKQSGEAVGWGFQLQQPEFVAAMLYLFLLLGLSLLGMFEVPQWFGGIGADKAAKDSLTGSFFTGVLAVLVATPCTVPFMAPALSFAFTQNATTTLVVMAAMGAGLALPYLLVCFYPALQQRLPKPGAWMVRFREFMAFPMFGAAAWLLWVLSQQISSEGLAAVLAVMVLIPFILWVDSGKRKHVQRGLIALVAFAMLGSFSVIQPASIRQATPYNEAELAELRAEGKAVFVDATAAWCITCKVNERLALSSKVVKRAFAEKDVTVMVADWTNHDEAITRLLSQYGHEGVPLYVYFPPDKGEPVVLPQLLTESMILNLLNGATYD